MNDTIKSLNEKQILVLELAHPESSNSFGNHEANQILKCLKSSPHVKGVILHAMGSPVFCSGGNLKEYARLGKSRGAKVNFQITQMLSYLSKLSLPTAVVVDGDCYGGGIELISAFNKIYCTPRARFGFWQRRVGLSFGWGGGQRLFDRVTKSKLIQVCLDTKTLSSYEAQALGLVDEISPSHLILNKAMDWILEQITLPQKPVALLKSLNQKNESSIFKKLWFGNEHKERLRKFTKSKIV